MVKIKQLGVPMGLFKRRIDPGYVLENGIVLLETERDEYGRYIGGAGMDGMYLKTNERYEPVRDDDGQIVGFLLVEGGYWK